MVEFWFVAHCSSLVAGCFTGAVLLTPGLAAHPVAGPQPSTCKGKLGILNALTLGI